MKGLCDPNGGKPNYLTIQFNKQVSQGTYEQARDQVLLKGFEAVEENQNERTMKIVVRKDRAFQTQSTLKQIPGVASVENNSLQANKTKFDGKFY